MKVRLLWLFVLVCAFLLALGLMVAAEGTAEAGLPSYRPSCALPGPVARLPAEAKAEQAAPSRVLPLGQEECPPQRGRTVNRWKRLGPALRLVAYHASPVG